MAVTSDQLALPKRRGPDRNRPNTTRARRLRPSATAMYATGESRAYRGTAAILLAPVGGLDRTTHRRRRRGRTTTFYQYQSNRPQKYVGGAPAFSAATTKSRPAPPGGRRRWTRSRSGRQPHDRDVGHLPTLKVQIAGIIVRLTEATYLNGFITETISLNRVTITGGVRFDHQESSLGNASVPGVEGSRSCRL